jgi:hypothetical protein
MVDIAKRQDESQRRFEHTAPSSSLELATPDGLWGDR